MFGKKKSQKILTVGLLHGNRPVLEHRVQGRKKVTIGSHKKNTFVIESRLLPPRFVLLKPQGDRYLLTFLPKMLGKIAVRQRSLPLTTLIERGVVETKKGSYSVSISDKTRGKVIIDNYRVLFRFDDA